MPSRSFDEYVASLPQAEQDVIRQRESEYLANLDAKQRPLEEIFKDQMHGYEDRPASAGLRRGLLHEAE